MAPRVTNLALQYVTTGVALSSSWKVMKPHMSSLLASVVFPLCCFDDEDEELWDDDPQEYIRKVNEQGGTCRMSAAQVGGGVQPGKQVVAVLRHVLGFLGHVAWAHP